MIRQLIVERLCKITMRGSESSANADIVVSTRGGKWEGRRGGRTAVRWPLTRILYTLKSHLN